MASRRELLCHICDAVTDHTESSRAELAAIKNPVLGALGMLEDAQEEIQGRLAGVFIPGIKGEKGLLSLADGGVWLCT